MISLIYLKMKQKFQLKSVPMLIILAMVLLSSELFAQKKIDYTQLRGKEWVVQLPEEKRMFIVYTYGIDSCTTVAKYSTDSAKLQYIYYLSDDWNGTFDDTKVGVWVAGKYLIEKKEHRERKVILISVYEILKLTETDLEWRCVESIDLTEEGKELSRQKNNAIIKFKSKQE